MSSSEPLTSAWQPNPSQRRLQRLFAKTHIWVYQASGGRIGHRLGPVKTLLLTTIGRKTGQPRLTPITYFPDGDAFVLVASNYGSSHDPVWLLNLREHPDVTVRVGTKILQVQASVATPDEKQRLWPMAVRYQKMYADYQRKTPRNIPLVILRPTS